jgi:arylsulfatase A-like enzyme
MINRRKFIKSSLRAGLTGYLGFQTIEALGVEGEDQQVPSQSSGNQPDIIFLMSDQQRWDALGVLNPNIHTPNLDRLAKNGVVFNQAVCQSPSCVPSRNSMMFGLYPSQLRVFGNGSQSIDDSQMPCQPLPALLRKAGYQTAGFGKTHWGRTFEPKSTRGFDVRVVGAKEVGLEKGARYQDDENPQGLSVYRKEVADYGPGEEGVAGYVGCTSQVPERDHRDGYVAEKCLEFLETGVDPNRPLFLYLSFLKPHAGLNVPKQFEDLYDINTFPDTEQPPWGQEPDTHLAYSDIGSDSLGPRYQTWLTAWSGMTPLERRRTTLRYYANCSWLDHYFGQVMDKLENLGRLKNSLIIYTSDHGEMLGERNFRFSKYCLYDSSVRVPLILSGSAVPENLHGTVDERPAELVDLYPTIAREAEVSMELKPPGLNLLDDQKHIGSFSEYHDSGAPAYMWRTKKWKLILFLTKPLDAAKLSPDEVKGELYNLETDPHEWENLYNNHEFSDIREKLKTGLLMHLACTWSSLTNINQRSS